MTKEEAFEKLINKTKELQKSLIDAGNNAVGFEKALVAFVEAVRRSKKNERANLVR